MSRRHYFLIFVLAAMLSVEAYGQDSVARSNQKRIEDLRARVSRLSHESTDSLILMLRDAIRVQRDSLKTLSNAVKHYQVAGREFSYSSGCDCHRIYYGLDRYEANYAAYPVLDSISSVLKNDPALRIRLVGHADRTGTRQFNQALALKRAEHLKSYLVRKYGLAPERIIAEGRGSDENIQGIADPYLFHLNRRVEITVFGERL